MKEDREVHLETGRDQVIEDIGALKKELANATAADDDIALKLVDDAAPAQLSPEQVRRVTRKIDLYLMPLLIVTFMLQYVDKILLSGAAQFGIVQDLHLYKVAGVNSKTHEPILNLHRYSNVTLIFYWGCLAACK
jgi:hypothetical protein